MSAVGNIIIGLVQLLNLVIIVWCLLSWFPNIHWHEQPFRTLDRIVQPIIAPFRRLIPPIANIDLSPMVAIFVLQAIMMVVRNFFQ